MSGGTKLYKRMGSYNMKIQVLDKGYVKLIEPVMGSDKAIVNAARVSYGGDADDNAKMTDGDIKLLRYLMRHLHTSPFEMAEMKFEMKMPIFVARQFIRHRTANVNEISGRYTEMEDDFYMPDSLRTQSKSNKQGSEGELNDPHGFNREKYFLAMKQAFDVYKELIEAGMAKEQARGILPLNTYTKWVWKMDLRNLLHFLKLRLDLHAQWEIREYANAIADMVANKFPFSYAAFVDYQFVAKTFSSKELKVIREVSCENPKLFRDEAKAVGLEGREYKEFLDKVEVGDIENE